MVSTLITAKDDEDDKKKPGDGEDPDAQEGKNELGKRHDDKQTTAGAPRADAEEHPEETSPASESGSTKTDYDVGLSANSLFIALMAVLAIKISLKMKAQ